MDKKQSRLRRARQTRARIARLGATRLMVFRSNEHIYAQVIDGGKGQVLASASTLDRDIRGTLPHGRGVEAATLVGRRIAEKAKQAGVEAVAFDRSGYRYHGRVKALAEAARQHGLKF